MFRPPVLALGLMACTTDQDAVDSQSVVSDDTSIHDSGQRNQHHSSVRITVEGSREGHLVGARQMQPGMLGDVWVDDSVVDGEAWLSLSPPNMSELTDDGFGVGHAVFLVVLRADENGNGVLDIDEPIHGIAGTQLLYLADDPNPGSPFEGFVSGWNVWRPSEAAESGVDSAELEPIDIVASLAPVETMTLAGTADVPAEPADPIRMTAFPLETEPVSGSWSEVVFDEVLTSQWSVTISDPPSSDHLNRESDLGPSGMEVPVVYIDVDESGSLHLDTDEILHHVCFEGSSILLQWVAELRDLSLVLALEQLPPIGWSVTASSKAQWLDSEQMSQLRAEAGCQMEGG